MTFRQYKQVRHIPPYSCGQHSYGVIPLSIIIYILKITRVKTYGRSRGKFMTALFGLEQDMSTWGEVYSLPAYLLHTRTRAHYVLLTEKFSRIFQGPESSEPLLHC